MMKRLLGDREDDDPRKKVETILTQYSLYEKAKCSVCILLAEDNFVCQKLDKAMLTGGYRVEVAHNGTEAVEKFTASPDKLI